MFNTYIEDKAMIPVLLGFDWMVSHNTWTDCPQETYIALKKRVIHNGNAKELSGFSDKSLPYSKNSAKIIV